MAYGKGVVMTEKGRIALAEAIGTLILVVAGPGTAVLAKKRPATSTSAMPPPQQKSLDTISRKANWRTVKHLGQYPTSK